MCFLLTLISCGQYEAPKQLKSILDKAGANRTELEKVLQYFAKNSEDSLKLKAATFLIKNMEGLHYYEGEQLNQYYSLIGLAEQNINDQNYFLRTFEELYDPFDYKNLKKVNDIETVRSSAIIDNVNLAFRVWQEQPWGKDISFDQFCEYILPFRISNALPEGNREEIFHKYNPLLDSVRKVGGDAIMACQVLNNELRKDGWVASDHLAFMPNFPASRLLKHRIGSCRDMTDAAVYIMRAVGIPVAIDAVHKWPYKKNSHAWNVVLAKDNRIVTFMGMEQSPGTTNKPGTKKGKVYRKTYALNPEFLQLQKDEDNIVPVLFREARLKDVTDEYVKTYNMEVPLSTGINDSKYAFLAVFSNKDWVPIMFTKVSRGQAVFKKLEQGIVYLPTYFDKSLKNIPAAYPRILRKYGETTELRPNHKKRHTTMTFSAIYPYIPDQFRVVKLWGGKIQGANDRGFKHPIDLFIMQDPLPFWNNVQLRQDRKFRYFRYLPASGYATDLSELQFYYKASKIKGMAIGSNGTSEKDSSINNIVDNDFGTRFITKYSNGTWVGIDMGAQTFIDEIRYAAGINEKKNTEIIVGDKYELLYWGDSGGWVSRGVKTATQSNIKFFDVPSNALYLLRNITRESDERIFTYENKRQIWW